MFDPHVCAECGKSFVDSCNRASIFETDLCCRCMETYSLAAEAEANEPVYEEEYA